MASHGVAWCRMVSVSKFMDSVQCTAQVPQAARLSRGKLSWPQVEGFAICLTQKVWQFSGPKRTMLGRHCYPLHKASEIGNARLEMLVLMFAFTTWHSAPMVGAGVHPFGEWWVPGVLTAVDSFHSAARLVRMLLHEGAIPHLDGTPHRSPAGRWSLGDFMVPMR